MRLFAVFNKLETFGRALTGISFVCGRHRLVCKKKKNAQHCHWFLRYFPVSTQFTPVWHSRDCSLCNSCICVSQSSGFGLALANVHFSFSIWPESQSCTKSAMKGYWWPPATCTGISSLLFWHHPCASSTASYLLMSSSPESVPNGKMLRQQRLQGEINGRSCVFPFARPICLHPK